MTLSAALQKYCVLAGHVPSLPDVTRESELWWAYRLEAGTPDPGLLAANAYIDEMIGVATLVPPKAPQVKPVP